MPMKPYEGAAPYIFVSYSHKDSDAVMPVIADMCNRGCRVWWDEGIDPGTEWPETIAEHVEHCNVFLAMISDNAIDSHNCRREINFAIELKKRLLCVFIAPTELSPGMRMQLNSLQQIRRYAYPTAEAFYEKLYGTTALKSSTSQIIQGMTEKPTETGEKTTATLPVQPVAPPVKPAAPPVQPAAPPVQPITPPVKPAAPPVQSQQPLQKLTPKVVETDASYFQYRKQRGVVTITGTSKELPENVVVPAFIDGASVEIIGKGAFERQYGIRTVILPYSITKIQNQAFFGCHNLCAISIQEGVTNIGGGVFMGCMCLDAITLPDSVIRIGGHTFLDCEQLSAVDIPKRVKVIEYCLFSGCENLQSVTIPTSVDKIGRNAFDGCINLKSLHIPQSVAFIRADAFKGCHGLFPHAFQNDPRFTIRDNQVFTAQGIRVY